MSAQLQGPHEWVLVIRRPERYLERMWPGALRQCDRGWDTIMNSVVNLVPNLVAALAWTGPYGNWTPIFLLLLRVGRRSYSAHYHLQILALWKVREDLPALKQALSLCETSEPKTESTDRDPLNDARPVLHRSAPGRSSDCSLWLGPILTTDGKREGGQAQLPLFPARGT